MSYPDKVDFGGNAHRLNVRAKVRAEFFREIDKRNAEFEEALRREGKSLRDLLAERLAELLPEWEACHYSDPPMSEIQNLIDAVEEFLNDN